MSKGEGTQAKCREEFLPIVVPLLVGLRCLHRVHHHIVAGRVNGGDADNVLMADAPDIPTPTDEGAAPEAPRPSELADLVIGSEMIQLPDPNHDDKEDGGLPPLVEDKVDRMLSAPPLPPPRAPVGPALPPPPRIPAGPVLPPPPRVPSLSGEERIQAIVERGQAHLTSWEKLVPENEVFGVHRMNFVLRQEVVAMLESEREFDLLRAEMGGSRKRRRRGVRRRIGRAISEAMTIAVRAGDDEGMEKVVTAPTTRARGKKASNGSMRGPAKGGAKWAETAWEMLTDGEEGTEWKDVVGLWWKLEESTGFESSTKTLPTSGRPKEVAMWVRNAQKGIPDVLPQSFSDQWWQWWTRINPECDWEELRCPGQNGLLNVLACLKWWRNALGRETEDWLDAMRDVAWALSQMQRALLPLIPAARPPRKHSPLPPPLRPPAPNPAPNLDADSVRTSGSAGPGEAGAPAHSTASSAPSAAAGEIHRPSGRRLWSTSPTPIRSKPRPLRKHPHRISHRAPQGEPAAVILGGGGAGAGQRG
ncbi:hypothetical protein B0H14DRAFT_2651204 [Mycena olivaceomarginata]|nr:hypothetical protein B0H14DRAFT_2651204 [Mycena olivaceomarginata]